MSLSQKFENQLATS